MMLKNIEDIFNYLEGIDDTNDKTNQPLYYHGQRNISSFLSLRDKIKKDTGQKT